MFFNFFNSKLQVKTIRLLNVKKSVCRWKSSFGVPGTQFTGHFHPTLGIRREDASVWERRAPLAPLHVRKLVKEGVRVIVQPSNRRAYPLQSYVQAGAIVQEDISDAPVIIGVKQVPIDSLMTNKTYAFFSHTHKAQEANMPMLDAILDRNIRLIDYEKMVDESGQRVVAFGKYAGVAGMINILHGLGLRLLALGHHTPFMHIGPAHNYRNSGMAKQAVRDAGYEIALGMMPRSIGPLTFVFTGSGNVSQGAQEIFQELPYEYVDIKDLPQVSQLGQTNKIYGAIVSRSDHIVPKDGGRLDPEEFENNPEKYYSNFATDIAPFASVIINGIYWAPNSPKLLTIPDAKRLLQPTYTPWLPISVGSPALPHRLLAICDISADPGGSIEFMTECTTIDNPFCLYDADYNQHSDSFAGPGVLVCSIDNMPTQLPLEATQSFGDLLSPYIFDIIKSDATKHLDENKFGSVVHGACITSNGKLTPNFEYITEMRNNRFLTKTDTKISSKTKKVLVLGAGYVSGPLVDILTRDDDVHVTIASALQGQGESLVKKAHSNANSLVLDVTKGGETLDKLIADSDLVISLLPYTLHPTIAEKCIKNKTNMVTASYLTPEMRQLNEAAVEAGITIVNEVGLDPGIDHLLAMECFDQVTSSGGTIKSFVSFCGGLPAPENADNALRYKFSWNPKGVLLNTLSGAKWIEDNEVKEIASGGALMDSPFPIDFLHGFNLEGYPNRDSTIYRDVYRISNAKTILRGTLRYKGFCDVMKGLHQLGLLSNHQHPSLHNKGPEITWRNLMCTLLNQKDDILISNLRNVVAEKVGGDHRRQAIEDLGLFEEELVVKLGTPLDTITHFLSNKLAFNAGERDLIIMRHDIGIEWPDGTNETRNINLVVYGDPHGYSAMAKTVGYPAGIASKMLLNGEIQTRGMVVPMKTEIYHPMLKRLQQEGISSIETSTKSKL